MDEALDAEERAIQAMRDEVKRLLADALRVADETEAETDRLQHVHDDEMSAAQKDHADEVTAAQERQDDETLAVQDVHDDEIRHLRAALATRDTIGQAKGIIMVTMRCDPDKAFDLIKRQSQAENRKVIDVAAELVARVSRRAAR